MINSSTDLRKPKVPRVTTLMTNRPGGGVTSTWRKGIVFVVLMYYFGGAFWVDASRPANAVTLTGLEVAALGVAARDFKDRHYSVSGDLRHYTVTIERKGQSVEIAFLANEPRPLRKNEAGTVGGTAYGLHVTYVLSLSQAKIIEFYFSK